MPLAVALILAVFVLQTLNVLMVNVLVVWPLRIVTLLTVGLATLSLLLESVTIVSAGAGQTRLTVPVTLLPPVTVLGLKVNEPTLTGKILNVLFTLTGPRAVLRVAVIVGVCVALTVVVVKVKVALSR